MSSPLIGSLSVSISVASWEPPAKRPRLIGAAPECDCLHMLLEQQVHALAVDWEGRFGLDRPAVVEELVRLCCSLIGEDEHLLLTTWSVFVRFMFRIQVERIPELGDLVPVVSQSQLRSLLFLALTFATDCVSSLEQEDQLGSLNEWAAMYALLEAGDEYITAATKVRVCRGSTRRDLEDRAAQIAALLSAKNKFALVLDWRVRSPTCWDFLTVFTERLRAEDATLAGLPVQGLRVESIRQQAFEYLVPASLLLYEVVSPSVVAAVALTLAVKTIYVCVEGRIDGVPTPHPAMTPRRPASHGHQGLTSVEVWQVAELFEEAASVNEVEYVLEHETKAIESLKTEVEQMIKNNCRDIIAHLYRRS
jgi:hypothetical protein